MQCLQKYEVSLNYSCIYVRRVEYYGENLPSHMIPPLATYNSVQMFEPFQDRNQHLFGTVSLS